jgi:hypothetical protein
MPPFGPSGNSFNQHLGRWNQEACWVNLSGEYQYLADGYYVSQDLEVTGASVHPTCKEILDAFIVPLFLEKARLAGLPVPVYYITNDYFEPPVLVDSMNPFMSRSSIVLKQVSQESVSRSLTRNYTYAICCQVLPPGSRVGQFRAVLGNTWNDRFRPLAAKIWEVFRMPLASVRIIVLETGDVQLSGLRPLEFSGLTRREISYLNREIAWPK